MENNERIKDFVNQRNLDKVLFTAGPASLLPENITGLRPAFGRGDLDYETIENNVLNNLIKISGQSRIVRMQGSATLAIEIMTLNFLYGKILVINTGYYSDRLLSLVKLCSKNTNQITLIDTINWENIEHIIGKYDWIVSCYTETSKGIKIDLKKLKNIAIKTKSKIMLDATASIGLEENHEMADVIAFSSCKGLFGLTGASFISFNEMPQIEVDSFYLNLSTHIEKKITGPYHSICSLVNVLPKIEEFKFSVFENKRIFLTKMKSHIINNPLNEPLLCTYVNCKISTNDKRVILYNSRANNIGSIVCHLGEAHLGNKAKGEILNLISSY